MPYSLDVDTLMEHVRALADGIGPRPPGSPAEAQARAYIREQLARLGYTQIEELPFTTVDEPVYSFFNSLLLSVGGAALGEVGGRAGKLLGAAAALGGAASYLWWTMGERHALYPLAPQHPSATLVLRIPPTGPVRRRAVLIGHTDTQRAYPMFQPAFRGLMRPIYTQALVLMGATALLLLARAAGLRAAAPLTWASVALQAPFLFLSRPGAPLPYVAGANDNATAVACLLGIAAALREAPLRETEVWLAFTGAEEAGLLGVHALLDAHGDELREAQFIDFEMVGSDEVVYVTRHSGLTYFSPYEPDPGSLALAQRTAAAYPELRIGGRELMMFEEVATLRRRGFGGLCIAGVGPDGWLENWHLPSDVSANIKPDGLGRAARFGLAMLRTLEA